MATGTTRFRDRAEAGRALAERLRDYTGRDDVLVLALPRGGVAVAAEVAKALDVPFDVFVVRKIGVPGHEELAMGAIASGDVLVLDRRLIQALGLAQEEVRRAVEAELRELERREAEYRGGRRPLDLKGKTVILVDDGLATGSTMRAAGLAVRKYEPARIVVAVPVASEQACEQFRDDVDVVICVLTPSSFRAVGMWYDDFSQLDDEQVRKLLSRDGDDGDGAGRTATVVDVLVSADDADLRGDFVLPEQARGIVAFAHGSGSSRHSPRNRRVAATLVEAGFGTLLLDLLTPAEEERDRFTGELRFDIGLLARRLIAAIDWLRRDPRTAPLRIGLFGASTGAAAALVAAAERPHEVGAVVSRGGRPDLAGEALARVRAPTLLIVGGADFQVLELNRRALELLNAEKQLVVVPGATHLFEEPEALEQVAKLAADWFSRYLPAPAAERDEHA